MQRHLHVHEDLQVVVDLRRIRAHQSQQHFDRNQRVLLDERRQIELYADAVYEEMYCRLESSQQIKNTV